MERELDDDERRRLEQEALGGLLGADPGVKPPSDLPPVTAPTSNTMPVDAGAPIDRNPVDRAQPSPAPTPAGGFTWNQGHDFSAFDTQRAQDPAKSAKDAFAMVSNQAPSPPFSNKAALPDWFNQNVRPGFEQLGHKVLSVDGDGFTYTNHEGTFHVDFAQNAGAAPGSMLQRLQWNATPADDTTRARYASGGGGAGAYTPRAGGPTPAPSAPVMPPPTDQDAMARVQAEIDALMKGGSTPIEEDALRKLLGGAV